MDTKPDSMDVQVGVVAALVGLGVLWFALKKKSEPPPPPPPPGTANVYGVVTSTRTGAGIAAMVTLTAQDGTTLTVSTDAGGVFSFMEIPVVPATWKVTADDYVEDEGTIDIIEGNNELNVALVPIPPPADNIITFGTLTGNRETAVDVGGYPLGFGTCNLNCPVHNQGPATVRNIQVIGIPQGYGSMTLKTIAVSLPANGSAVLSYHGNPVGAGSILLSVMPYEIYLGDAPTGEVSNSITI